MSNIIVQGNEINAKQYVEKITIEGIGEEKSLNPRLIVADTKKLSWDYIDSVDLNKIIHGTLTRTNYRDNGWYATYAGQNTNPGHILSFTKQNEGWSIQDSNYGSGGYSNVVSFVIKKKIPKELKKLYLKVKAARTNAQYPSTIFRLLDVNKTINFDEWANPSPVVKEVVLAAYNWTTSQINNQSGVVINSTDNNKLDYQTVEIDLSNINADTYVSIWICDSYIYLYSLTGEY